MQSPGPGTAQTPGSASKNREQLLKVTFSVTHQTQEEDCCMFVTGSLPSLGSWEAKRARKMTAGENGTWDLAVYIPHKAEFLYQYLLIKEGGDPEEPTVLWEGGIDRKLKLGDAASTPAKALRLRDDTTGEACGTSIVTSTPIRSDPLAPSAKDDEKAKLAVKEEEIKGLIEERESVRNEMQKIKDILGFSDDASASTYKKRCSYLPDQGPLYETARQLQTQIRSKLLEKRKSMARMSMGCVVEGEGGGALENERTEHEATKAALDEKIGIIASLEEQFKAEKEELKDYYQRSFGEMDDNQRQLAEQKMRQEEMRTMLQSSVRVAAGELHDLKEDFGGLRQCSVDLRDAVTSCFEELEKNVCDKVYGFSSSLEQDMSITQEKLRKEVIERKRLHNTVLELKGNIRVFARSRPLFQKETAAGKSAAVTFPSESELLVNHGGKVQSYQYDMAFGPNSTQDEVFQETQPLVISVLDGYNVCIFAYGQTGSGKTFTMQGYGDSPGVNPRALEELFSLSEERKGSFEYEISVSLLEIYNESIRDLVEPNDSNSGEMKKLDVKMAPEGGTYIPYLAVVAVSGMTDVMKVLKTGEGNRSVGCTNMNEHSSRSHMILTVHVKSRNCATGARGFGKMHLIDLAGSERVGKSGAEGARLKEAQNINKSLSALGDCVQSLVSKSKHTPFRNSKLTHLLQDSLGGDSKALMFVCVSPSDSDASETGCSLAFASRVRNVELGPAKRKGGCDALTELKLKDKDREIEGLREMMRKVEGDKVKAEAKAKQLAMQKDEVEASKLSMSHEIEHSIGEREAEMMGEINALRSQLDDANHRLEEATSSQWAHKRAAPQSKVSAPKTPRRGDSAAPKTPRQTPGKRTIEPKKTPTASRAEASKTPSRGGATPRRGALRPMTAIGNTSVSESGSSSMNASTNKSLNKSDAGLSLDERLARLRTKKREAAELASQEHPANTSIAPPAKRPHTAMPARVGGTGSRLGGGAARVVKGSGQAGRPAMNASVDHGGKKPRTGGWR